MYPYFVLALLTLSACQQSMADVICPDQQSACPDETTCCQLPTKQWGCCPMASAVCCKDGLHCCPEMTTCNLEAMTCDNQTSSGRGRRVYWLDNSPSTPTPTVQGLRQPQVKCSDGSYCDNGSTCCRTQKGLFGCCPVKNAVCCDDGIHCCSSGSECSAQTGRCTQLTAPFGSVERTERKWMKKYQAIIKAPVICPDQQSQCPEDTTCCQLESGDYGCCPMPQAVCCEDKIHCCPQGTTCDVAHQKCNQGTGSIHWFQKTKSYPINDIVCPDKKSHCPSGATCCALSDQSYGCCPLPQAVCCEDHLHCCPTGTTCNVEEETCMSSRGIRVPWFLKFKPQ